MPEEQEQREVADALEHAVAAVESEPPGHVMAEHARLRRGDKLKSTAAVLTALAALIAATGAFLKTLDHGVTESAYNTLSVSIVKLSDQQQRTGEDVAMLRGYLDGLSRAPIASASASPTPPPTSEKLTVVLTPIDAGAMFAPRSSYVHVSPPPTVAPPAAPVKPPSFAAAISK